MLRRGAGADDRVAAVPRGRLLKTKKWGRLPRERRQREEEQPRVEPQGTLKVKGPVEEGTWRGG